MWECYDLFKGHFNFCQLSGRRLALYDRQLRKKRPLYDDINRLSKINRKRLSIFSRLEEKKLCQGDG